MRKKKTNNGDAPSLSVSRTVETPPVPPEPSLVATGKHSTGFITVDDLGRPRWGWMDELAGAEDESDTTDVLRALHSDALSLADDAENPWSPVQRERGYDPYDTVRIRVPPRLKRR